MQGLLDELCFFHLAAAIPGAPAERGGDGWLLLLAGRLASVSWGAGAPAERAAPARQGTARPGIIDAASPATKRAVLFLASRGLRAFSSKAAPHPRWDRGGMSLEAVLARASGPHCLHSVLPRLQGTAGPSNSCGHA